MEIEQGKMQAWHTLEVKSVIETLKTDFHVGLSVGEAARRLAQHGPNTIEAMRRVPWYLVFGRQFLDGLILILVAAAAIALAIGEVADAVAILAIVLVNGILGFAQEWRAERAIEALKRMLSPHCRVLRDGREQEVEATTLVPGDLVLLKIGDRVPADLRLAEALNLRVDESALTGESEPVNKQIEPVEATAPLGERSSMAWMGTAVTNGRGHGVAVATAMATEFGRIARLTQMVGEEVTPLQRKLAVLGKQLGALAIGVSVMVGASGWLLGKPLFDMFLTGVALAVAVVPEGLPAVVTITLALGIRAMVRRRALLRRLQAAETLGSATVICTDKTGTLTQNEMTVQRIWVPAGEVEVTGVGYEPAGHFQLGGRRIDHGARRDLLALLETGLRCNRARIQKETDGWHGIGEPTESALVVVSCKAGLHPEESSHSVTEFSFNSMRKRMTIVEDRAEGLIAHVKGAPEVILERSSRILDGERERELSEADRGVVNAAYQSLAEQGLRTLALARRLLPRGMPLDEEEVERGLTLLGIVGIADPPRPEVPDAIRLACSAGIRVIMITGDAAATALSIARRIGLRAGRAISGSDLNAMDDAALRAALAEEVLFARTTPEHKLRIVTLLQEMGHVAGMTGDGVNDAPALKKADIGIAMGLRGTDVARGAADMILTDDNFASIVGAVEEGRRQYDNIQKFVRYLLSSNTGEVLAIFVNILLGGPLILLPVQILWMNLLTDGVTAVALGVEPAETGIMRRPPRSPRQPMLDRRGIIMMLLLGTYMGMGTLWLFHHYLGRGGEERVALAQTVAFTGLILLEKVNVFNFRALHQPMVVVGFFSNPWLLLAWGGNMVLQICVVYVPFLQSAFHTVPLRLADWGLVLVVAVPVFLVTEAGKWWYHRGTGEDRDASSPLGRSGP